MKDDDLKIGGKYRHYKNQRLYKVLGKALHSETKEEMVIYRALYDCPTWGKERVWARPKQLFLEEVADDNGISDRFQCVEEMEENFCFKFCFKITSCIKGLWSWLKKNLKAMGCMTWFLIGLSAVITIIGFFIEKDLFTCAAVVLAAAAIAYQNNQQKLKIVQDNSKFYLEKYIDAAQMILERLDFDSPTRRLAWYSAGSIAEKIKIFNGKITEQPDKDFLEIYRINFYHLIFELIKDKPVQYFYGVDKAKSFDEAFDGCGYGKFSCDYGLRPHFPELTFIDKESIKRIIDIFNGIWKEVPEWTYISNIEFMNFLKFPFPNIWDYLNHFEKSTTKKGVKSVLVSEKK